ncbi:MAG TPA: GDSL-type esterase/lipase family protein [Dehalococcoidia bacterium]|nr:GDSL-type esterase/lipase family protein [Dehalococcoidia bacterium]
MRAIELEGGAVRITGALDFDRLPTGIVPRRLPAWTRPQVVDPLLAAVVAMPSGVRLEFVTDADAIELEAMLTSLQVGTLPLASAAFDLVIDGSLAARLATGDRNIIAIDLTTFSFSFVPGAPATVRFEGLGSGSKRIELWLPQSATVELRALRVPDGASVGPPAPDARRRWVHYGSSISHCWEAEGPTGIWPAVTARLAGVALQPLGLWGSCHLDQFAARTIRDLPADVISVKAGINVVNVDSLKERTFGPALHGFLDTVREGHAETPLLVVSPVIFPAGEDDPGPSTLGADNRWRNVERPEALRGGALALRRIRQIMADVIERRRAAGDVNLHYLDGLRLFGETDVADLADGLHPNAAGYQRIGERFHALAFGEGAPLAHPATAAG